MWRGNKDTTEPGGLWARSLQAQGLALIRHTAETELGLKHSHCKTHIEKPVNAQRLNCRPHCPPGPSTLPGSQSHLSGTEADHGQAEDRGGCALAPTQDWHRAQLAGGRRWVGGPRRQGAGCPGGPRARLTLWRSRGPLLRPPAPWSTRGTTCPRLAVLPSAGTLPGAAQTPSLQSSSDPPALPSLRPTAAPISEEKRGPYKDDTEQTVCFPENTGPRPPSAWYLLTPGSA